MGTHEIRLTFALQEHPSVTTYFDFNVVFECDPGVSVTIQKDSAASSLNFQHDPNSASGTVVDLSMFSWSPDSSCFQYDSYEVVDIST